MGPAARIGWGQRPESSSEGCLGWRERDFSKFSKFLPLSSALHCSWLLSVAFTPQGLLRAPLALPGWVCRGALRAKKPDAKDAHGLEKRREALSASPWGGPLAERPSNAGPGGEGAAWYAAAESGGRRKPAASLPRSPPLSGLPDGGELEGERRGRGEKPSHCAHMTVWGSRGRGDPHRRHIPVAGDPTGSKGF